VATIIKKRKADVRNAILLPLARNARKTLSNMANCIVMTAFDDTMKQCDIARPVAQRREVDMFIAPTVFKNTRLIC
jgi:hypothetical protein